MYDMSLEKNCWVSGKTLIGIDEAGYGCAYGSMWVAAVCFPAGFVPSGELLRVRDSKRTSAAERSDLSAAIIQAALHYDVVEITAQEINAGNVFQLRFSAIHSRLQSWDPAVVYFDGNVPLIGGIHENNCLVKGDAKCYTIAAASILAKSKKDAEMHEADRLYPGYDLANNQGYLSASHMAALRSLGKTPGHRTKYCKNFVSGP